MCRNEKDKFSKVHLVLYVRWNYNCKKKQACLHGIPIMIGKSMKFNRDSAMVKALLWRKPIG